MAISPPVDIVLDVARAASADDVAAARERLAARVSATGAPAFDVAAPAAPFPTKDADATPEAFKKFEAMMLQSFIQSMLPEEGEAVYGKGLAGDMWRSMMAEQIAGVMADSGGIGVADRILKNYYGRSEDQAALDAAGRSLVTQSILHEAQRMALQPGRADTDTSLFDS